MSIHPMPNTAVLQHMPSLGTGSSPLLPSQPVAPAPSAPFPTERKRGKVTLQLIPAAKRLQKVVQSAGYHPKLELTFKLHKPISYVIEHLKRRWTKHSTCVVADDIRLFPPRSQTAHPGWGESNQEPTFAVYESLGKPQPFRLAYTWTVGRSKPKKTGKIAAASNKVAGMTQPLTTPTSVLPTSTPPSTMFTPSNMQPGVLVALPATSHMHMPPQAPPPHHTQQACGLGGFPIAPAPTPVPAPAPATDFKSSQKFNNAPTSSPLSLTVPTRPLPHSHVEVLPIKGSGTNPISLSSILGNSKGIGNISESHNFLPETGSRTGLSNLFQDTNSNGSLSTLLGSGSNKRVTADGPPKAEGSEFINENSLSALFSGTKTHSLFAHVEEDIAANKSGNSSDSPPRTTLILPKPAPSPAANFRHLAASSPAITLSPIRSTSHLKEPSLSHLPMPTATPSPKKRSTDLVGARDSSQGGSLWPNVPICSTTTSRAMDMNTAPSTFFSQPLFRGSTSNQGFFLDDVSRDGFQRGKILPSSNGTCTDADLS